VVLVLVLLPISSAQLLYNSSFSFVFGTEKTMRVVDLSTQIFSSLLARVYL
jgi:hypothetical protein